jgi:hypothetical protein
VLGPTGVRIGHESIGRFERSAHGMDAFDIDIGIPADFELESAVAFGAVSGDFGGHLFGGLLGNRSVQMKIGAVATTQERADGQRSVLAEQVPTRHVDRRFDVRVAFEGRVHSTVQPVDLKWVLADELRCKLGQSGANARCVGREIGGSQRTGLAPADEPCIAHKSHDRRVENRDGFSTTPFVGHFVEWQIDLIDAYFGNLHGS